MRLTEFPFGLMDSGYAVDKDTKKAVVQEDVIAVQTFNNEVFAVNKRLSDEFS